MLFPAGFKFNEIWLAISEAFYSFLNLNGHSAKLADLCDFCASVQRSQVILNRVNLQLHHVPIVQEWRYLSCSFVSVSISIPIDSSFNFATILSTSGGTL